MTGEVIRSFLVGLGFDVDDSSLAKFNKAIATATIKVAAMYAGIQAATTGIFYGIAKISEGFEQIGYEMRLVAPALNRFLVMKEAMLHAYRVAGVDLRRVVQQSILFNLSLAKTKIALEAAYKSVASRFFPLITKQMDIFRNKIFANMPKIQDSLEKFVQFIFKAFDITVQFGTRVWSILSRIYDFLKELDDATDGWSTIILGVVAAWKYLNLAFLATPFGALIAGIIALIVLWDDFKVWQEGGESFFDWSKAVPIINAVTAAVGYLKNALGDTMRIAFGLIDALIQFATGDFGHLTETIKNMANDLKSLGGSSLGAVTSLFGSSTVGAPGGPLGPPNPLLPQSAGSNQRVSQETNITVQGSADAGAVGKAVAGQQDRVNFDMTRNLKGAMR